MPKYIGVALGWRGWLTLKLQDSGEIYMPRLLQFRDEAPTPPERHPNILIGPNTFVRARRMHNYSVHIYA